MKNLMNQPAFSMDEWVFARRNKNYGAYVLRQEYESNLQRALLYTMLCCGLFFSSAKLIGDWQKKLQPEESKTEIIARLTAIPAPDILLPPMPAIAPPPAPVSAPVATQQFTTMQTVQDNQATSNGTAVQQLQPDVTIGTQNQTGTTGNPQTVQTTGNATTPLSEQVENWAEEMPVFAGGEKALYQFIQQHFDYPAFARDNDISGKVIVSFIVEKNGQVTDVKVVRSVHPSIDQEAVRVVSLFPAFSPGKQNGSPVRVRFNLPIRIELK